MRLQFTLTVTAAKWLIAKGIARLPKVRQALAGGRIILKGGTTVSALCQELSGRAMMISGRVSPRGAKTAAMQSSQDQPHAMLLHKGRAQPLLRDEWPRAVQSLGRDDLLISGANIIDAHGGAALMCGMKLCNGAGPWLAASGVEGFGVIIAAGLEKLIPGRVEDAVRRTGRLLVDRSYGMAVGLLPLQGEVFTELEAVKSLAPVECWIAGRGGIGGAEGAATLVVEGEASRVSIIEKAYLEVRGRELSGAPESLQTECAAGSPGCRGHLACVYKKKEPR